MKSPLLCPPLLPGQRPLSCLDRQRFKAERRGGSYMCVCLIYVCVCVCVCVWVKERECECVMKAGKVNEWVENEKKKWRWEFTSQLLYGNTVFSESTHCHTVEHSEINRKEMVMKSVCGRGVKLLSYFLYRDFIPGVFYLLTSACLQSRNICVYLTPNLVTLNGYIHKY